MENPRLRFDVLYSTLCALQIIVLYCIVWNLGRPFSRPEKSWKIAKVMECHGKSWKMMIMSCNFYRASAVAASPVLATIGMSIRPSVCLSVCPSVTRWHCVKTTQARITKSSPTDSPRTLVFGIKNSSRNSKGVTLSEGVKWEWGRKNSQFSANNSPYLRKGAR